MWRWGTRKAVSLWAVSAEWPPSPDMSLVTLTALLQGRWAPILSMGTLRLPEAHAGEPAPGLCPSPERAGR